MTQLTHKMGGDSVVTNTEAVLFTDGTEQFTAFTNTQGNSLQCGVVIFTGSTTSTVNFVSPYVATGAPAVVCEALDGAVSGEPSSLTVLGSEGDWTGFVLTLSHNLFGAYNWIALGNPN